ncbi:DNA polymerase I, thermostable-like [Ylistrum balloti]|uniref:DNA polymerase I, thermostable-like n=1 Tax=Ylistrum balloti TaxID=509963 RepID=UPI002905A4BC|nr:DNA polymerase I, thermostable-like [Ylistrum balloti]
MPFEYIFGKASFLEDEFIVNRHTLIPRPETEELVSKVITDPYFTYLLERSNKKNIKILDIGTGCGVIGITLKKYFSNADITGVDISSSALRVAKRNHQRILPKSIKNGIRWINADVFSGEVSKKLNEERFDLIVSNPPYIGWEEKKDLSSSVVDYEPSIALFAGWDGLDFYRNLSYHLDGWLEKEGMVYLELGWKQGEKGNTMDEINKEKETNEDKEINDESEEETIQWNLDPEVIKEREHDHLVCVLDSKGKTFRHEIFKEYKAHRPPMPNSLSKQIKVIVQVLDFLGIPVVSKTSLEADDLIAHYSRQSQEEVEIFSHDKDLMQLVNERVRVVQLDRQNQQYVIFDQERVEKKFQTPPNHLVDYLSLMGDSSDNIPGVKGVGEKTAVMLINEFGDLDSIYKNLDKIPEKHRKKLIQDKNSAFISRELVCLKEQLNRLDKSFIEDLPSLNDLTYQSCQAEKIKDIWELHECTSLIKKYSLLPPFEKIEGKTILEILKGISPTEITEDKNHLKRFTRHTLHHEEWGDLVETIKLQGQFVFDLETTSLVPFDAKVVSAVIVLPNQHSYYIPVVTHKLDLEMKWIETFKKVLGSNEIKKIGHNLKFEYSILKEKGIELNGIEHDTMIHAYMTEPDLNAFKLEDLIQSHFGVSKPSYKEMSKGYESILDIPKDLLEDYTFQDGEYTTLLYEIQVKGKALNDKELDIYKNWELPLLVVLANMEFEGVVIDTNYLKNLEKILQTSLSITEKEIIELAGEDFNINSTKQLQTILFEKLSINPVKKTKTGYSTDNYVLERLKKNYPIAESLLQHRKTAKLLNTYVEALPKLVHPRTGRIHTHYNQSVTATGRLSSTSPNLQNIPVSEGSQGIRRAFVVDSGYEIVSIDYSQVELRIVGFLSKDAKLLEAYESNRDIHTQTAHLLFGKPMEDVLSEERKIAKTINFSVIYGISAFSLAEDLGIPRNDAQVFIDIFFSNYSNVKSYQEKILHQARTNGWVETYFGRKRYIKDINSENMIVKNRAERIAFNTVIQGTASDIIKRAMVNVQKKFVGSPIKMVMQVHDELVFYVPTDLVKKTVPQLEKLLIDITPFDGILTVNTTIEKHWG